MFSVVLLGSCDKEIEGCTDPLAVNYNADATNDNGICEYNGDYMFSITINDTLIRTISGTIPDTGHYFPISSQLPVLILNDGGTIHTDYWYNHNSDSFENLPECISFFKYSIGNSYLGGTIYLELDGLSLGQNNNGLYFVHIQMSYPDIPNISPAAGFVLQSQLDTTSMGGGLLPINLTLGETSTFDPATQKLIFKRPTVGSFSGDVFGLSVGSVVNGTIVQGTFSVPIKLEFEFISPRFTMFD